MLPKTRLGKRSPLGALLSSSCPATGARPDHEINDGVKGHLGFKVFYCGADECSGLDQMDFKPSEASRLMCATSSRSVSSSIDVPKRSPEEVDMDELMAAMVLSSLSCSPLLHSPAPPESTAAGMDYGGSELSDSSSGYWSVNHSNRSPTPSPPITEPEGSLMSTDEGLNMELEQVLFEEPAPRRRRNLVKVAYRCLWPSCGKVLTSVVGIKKHIRTTHLQSGGSEHECCSHSEEDFYYTEIRQWEEPQRQSPPPLCDPAPSSPTHSLSPRRPTSPSSAALSSSAPSLPSSLWQVQVEHSYQASPSVITAAAPTAACRWTAPTNCYNKQDLSFRVRSVSVGEQWLQQQSASARRIRGEAKKCRKVYGIEHREQWCTACRWKKACQRFVD